MRRTLLALAIAGLSVAAYAAPPPGGGGPPMPIDVVVTGQPIAVIPTFTWSSEYRYFEWSFSEVAAPSLYPDKELEVPVVLTGVLLRLQAVAPADAGPLARCVASVQLKRAGAAQLLTLSAVTVLASKGVAETYVPLPNIYADAGGELRAATLVVAESGATHCVVDSIVYGVIPD